MRTVKFDVNIDNDAMVNFMLYHNYSNIKGWFGVLLSAVAFIYLILNFRSLEMSTIGVLIIITVLFTIVNPIMLRSKAINQVKRNKEHLESLSYELTEDAFMIMQDGECGEITWDKVIKVKDSGKSLIVYITAMRAFIWPKADLGSEYDAVAEILREKVGPKKVKIKEKK